MCGCWKLLLEPLDEISVTAKLYSQYYLACVGSETQRSLRWVHFNISFNCHDTQILRKYFHYIEIEAQIYKFR